MNTTELIFEQPLNEKVRSYLRLEYLAHQLDNNLQQDHQHRCFYPLFSLCELTERCDYRSEVIKDIDRQLIQLQSWQQQDQVDQQQLQYYLEQFSLAREALQHPQRPGSQLKQDRFISALRQRFSMPGACCNFDLPQLHFWLAKPWEERSQEFRQWTSHFNSLLQPISLILQLTRMSSEYRDAVAHAGFYQGDSQQSLSLVRVKLDAEHGCYPTISGHRNRFAIHFVQFDQQKHSDKTVKFLLATCS